MNAPTQTFHPDRTQFIGGSDCAAILGVSKWKTPFQLYQEKIGTWTEQSSPMRDKVLTRGKRWEPVVIEMLMDELELRGHHVEIIERNQRYTDAEYPFLACELDLELRIDGEEVNGEMKTVHPFSASDWGDEDTDEIPIYYAAQVMHGLMIKPRRRTVVAALIGADDLRVHWVERDDATIEGIRAKELAFWQHVQNREPPPPLSTEDVKWLYRRDSGAVADADEELANLVMHLKLLKAQYKQAEADIEQIATQVKARIGDAATLLYNGQKIATWKNNKPSVKIDFEAAYRDLAPPPQHILGFTGTKPGNRPLLLK